MKALPAVCFALIALATGALPDEAPPLRHSKEWITERMDSMLAVDDAYLWHNVLGGWAIHQNSMTNPPTVPNEGNFHTQQQSFFASVKMGIYELRGRSDPGQLDDAGELLNWVLRNGYDAEKRQFHLKYNNRTGEWNTSFYPEFNMISVSAMLAYDTYRPSPELVAAAENVLGRIVQTEAFQPEASKGLYSSGYIALKLLDAYDATGQKRFLDWAETVVDLAHEALWDTECGGWYYAGKPGGGVPKHTVKQTHTNSNLMQACLRLYLHGKGERFRERGVSGMDFVSKHLRSPDGGWWRHTNRDGSDPTKPPIVGDGANTEPGTPCVYDRMAQMIVACCLAYRATGDRKYLTWVDETLDKMEKTHLTRYELGVNYGYTRAADYENTWCHLWGLKAMIEIARLWGE